MDHFYYTKQTTKMAAAPRGEQSEDSDLLPLISHEHGNTQQYGTLTGSTGSDLRFIIHGSDKDLMDRTCDIILREKREMTYSEIQHRESHVFGRKISVVKTSSNRKSLLPSWLCFSRVTSIKDEMVDGALQVFPGPHAFLLVTDNREATWKTCLDTITEVFGKEASDYAVGLIIGTDQPEWTSSIKECEIYHLEDNDNSVQNLLSKIENMTRNKESTFFIQPSYKNTFVLWENQKEEQHAKKVNEITEMIESRYADEIATMLQNQAKTNTELKELLKKQESFKCHMIETLIGLKPEDSLHDVKPGVPSTDENLLIKELETCTDSDESLTKILALIVEELKNKLMSSKQTQSNVMDTFIHNETQLKNEIEKLQKEIKQLKAKDSEIEKKLMEAEGRESCANKQEEATLDRNLSTDLNKLQDNLDRQDVQEKLEEKTQHATSGSEHERHSSTELTSAVLSEENKDRTLDETAGKIKSRKEDSQASESHNSGDVKLVRRNSINKPPDMSEDHSGKKDSQASRSNDDWK